MGSSPIQEQRAARKNSGSREWLLPAPLGCLWESQAREGAWSPQRSGPEGWGGLEVRVQQLRAGLESGSGSRCVARSAGAPPARFPHCFILVVTYQFCLPESTGRQQQGQPRFIPTRSLQITFRGWQAGFKVLRAARNHLSCE